MIAIIPECNIDDFDLKVLGDHLQRALPSYAVPKFVRLNKNIECTSTHKIKKVNLKLESFDIDKIKDPLFVLLPGKSEYQPLTRNIYLKIRAGEYRF